MTAAPRINTITPQINALLVVAIIAYHYNSFRAIVDGLPVTVLRRGYGNPGGSPGMDESEALVVHFHYDSDMEYLAFPGKENQVSRHQVRGLYYRLALRVLVSGTPHQRETYLLIYVAGETRAVEVFRSVAAVFIWSPDERVGIFEQFLLLESGDSFKNAGLGCNLASCRFPEKSAGRCHQHYRQYDKESFHYLYSSLLPEGEDWMISHN